MISRYKIYRGVLEIHVVVWVRRNLDLYKNRGKEEREGGLARDFPCTGEYHSPHPLQRPRHKHQLACVPGHLEHL
jgi:hypothetical protein